MTTISPAQCRAARGLLDWSQQELATASGVGNTTICNFEGGHASPQQGKLDALRRAFERAGVAFVEKNGQGRGVLFREGSVIPGAESIPLENLSAENDE
jgi:transcriptional regulator with XRE-family HTH domain